MRTVIDAVVNRHRTRVTRSQHGPPCIEFADEPVRLLKSRHRLLDRAGPGVDEGAGTGGRSACRGHEGRDVGQVSDDAQHAGRPVGGRRRSGERRQVRDGSLVGRRLHVRQACHDHSGNRGRRRDRRGNVPQDRRSAKLDRRHRRNGRRAGPHGRRATLRRPVGSRTALCRRLAGVDERAPPRPGAQRRRAGGVAAGGPPFHRTTGRPNRRGRKAAGRQGGAGAVDRNRQSATAGNAAIRTVPAVAGGDDPRDHGAAHGAAGTGRTFRQAVRLPDTHRTGRRASHGDRAPAGTAGDAAGTADAALRSRRSR